MTATRPLLLVALLLGALSPACTSVRRDDPQGTREAGIVAPPLWWSSESPDGSSYNWWTLFGLVGADGEDQRSTSRALPIWWSARDGDAVSATLVFPLWYERTSPGEHSRWYGPLYRTHTTPEWSSHHVLLDVVDWGGDVSGERGRSGAFLLWDHSDHGTGRHDLTLVPVLGLAKLASVQWGFPPEGVTVGALDRQASRRVSVLDVLSLVHLFGYDDVGDTRELRLLSLFGNEVLSLARSWESRGDGAFRRQWLFPLWFDVADEGWRWRALGPLWGSIDDDTAGTATDWWLAGLLSRTETAVGSRWRLFGLPIAGH